MILQRIKNLLDKEETLPQIKSADNNQPSILDEYKASRKIPSNAHACLAPWTSISFNIDGVATVCCLNRKTSVNIGELTIDEIWQSDVFKNLREHVAAGDLTHDCSICLEQIKAGNLTGVKAASYDTYFPYHPERPAFMEFCLDNTCNLACTMCNSLLSSTIRKREHLPPLKKYYDEKFVEQLIPYIPYLKEAVFSGGEPFLIPIYYRIWEKMLELNSEMIIGVVTNGTTLTDKVKSLLERGRFKINLSLDAVNKEMYEKIRVNADLNSVMENLDWFKAYGERKSLPLNLPVCPLVSNWKNIPDIVRFANEKNVSLNFVFVDRPLSQALPFSDYELLQEIESSYEKEEFKNVSSLSGINILRFKGLIDEVKKWKANSRKSKGSQNAAQLLEKLDLKMKALNESPDDKLSAGEVMQKIGQILNQIPEGSHIKILEVFNEYSPDRLKHFLGAKTTDEAVLFFKEYVGFERSTENSH